MLQCNDVGAPRDECTDAETIAVALQIHALRVHTPCPLGGRDGCTVPCTIDILVAFGRDLLPLLPEAPMQWFTCGRGIPFVAAGDLPKPHY
jgi:hypothetical protein